jgi:uncharacterized protein (DUF2252 family)
VLPYDPRPVSAVAVGASPALELPDCEYLPHRSVAERTARGVARRHRVPIEAHADWQPSRRGQPITILERQAQERIPDLVPIRHGRMALSAFAFFRGGAAIMASDLASTPVSGLRVQLCGDAHLANFGLFDTPERRLLFDVNDFDETLPGPFEWDIKRLVASVEIAGRDLGFRRREREAAVAATTRAYREAMLEFAEQRNLDVWHARLSADELRERLERENDRDARKEVKKRIRQAMRHDHLHAFDRLVETNEHGIRFASRPPVLTPIEELLSDEQLDRYHEVVQSFLRQYRESLRPEQRALLETYRFTHMARKVVGVGSVGTQAWVVLKTGRDDHDPLLLQLKEAKRSVLAPYLGDTVYESQGRRVVEGQRLMQAHSDHMLGWYRLEAWDDQLHDCYVRQLWDGKASVEIANLTPKGLRIYGQTCGWTLARGHARTGERIAIAAYLGDDDAFDQALTAFASAYADTNQRDYERLLEAIDCGQISAAPGI